MILAQSDDHSRRAPPASPFAFAGVINIPSRKPFDSRFGFRWPVAEQLIYGESHLNTGAADDIRQATRLPG